MQIARQIFPAHWLQLPTDVRNRIALDLGLKRSGNSEVDVGNGRVVSDGYTAADLMGLTYEKMARYCGKPEITDELQLLELCADKAHSLLNPKKSRK